MKTLSIKNILDQKTLTFHLAIVVLSMFISGISSFLRFGSVFSEFQIDLFVLLILQLEFFIFIAGRIFKGLKPGSNRKELTKTVLSRFLLFMVVCFIAALIINILFLCIQSLIKGLDSMVMLNGFFQNEFGTWIRSTLGGLLFGAAIFIFIQWQDALKREQRLREENLIFQNETLKNQVNPHFLFNSLNTLSALVTTQPEVAEEFINRLSSIYRYILENSSRDKVPLGIELSFISDYFYLHKIRDDGKIQLDIKINETNNYRILPVSLQILVENAVKHNMATREHPLYISIYTENKFIIVKNNLQRMAAQLTSTKIGLRNLAERVRLTTGSILIVEETNSDFIVKIPLIQ
jgi:sensor histidine kinase YesM